MEFSFKGLFVLLYILSSMPPEPCAAGRPMSGNSISVSGVMFCSQCSQENELNVPMPGAQVQLQCGNRPPSSEATDENGLFTFTIHKNYHARQAVSKCKVLLLKSPNSQCDVSANVSSSDAAMIKIAAPTGSSPNEIKYSVGAFVYQTACRQSRADLLFHHLEGTSLTEESQDDASPVTATLRRVTLTLPPLPPLPPLPAISLPPLPPLPPLPTITLPPLPPLPPLPAITLPPLPAITLPPLPPLPPLPAITLPPLPPVTLQPKPPLPAITLPPTTLPPLPAKPPLSPLPAKPPLSVEPPLSPLPAKPPLSAEPPLSPLPAKPPLSVEPPLSPLPAKPPLSVEPPLSPLPAKPPVSVEPPLSPLPTTLPPLSANPALSPLPAATWN